MHDISNILPLICGAFAVYFFFRWVMWDMSRGSK